MPKIIRTNRSAMQEKSMIKFNKIQIHFLCFGEGLGVAFQIINVLSVSGGGGGSDNLIASSHGLVTTYPVTCSYMYMDVYMILPLVCVQLRNHDIRDVLFTQSKNVFHF